MNLIYPYAFNRLSGAFGSLLPDQITDDRVHAWTAERPLSVKVGTIHVELGYLRAALRWAAGKKLIPEPISIQLPSKPRPKTDYIPRSVFTSLIEETTTPHVRLFLVLGIATGARASALLDLTWDRVDFEKRLIHLDNPNRESSLGSQPVKPRKRRKTKQWQVLDTYSGWYIRTRSYCCRQVPEGSPCHCVGLNRGFQHDRVLALRP